MLTTVAWEHRDKFTVIEEVLTKDLKELDAVFRNWRLYSHAQPKLCLRLFNDKSIPHESNTVYQIREARMSFLWIPAKPRESHLWLDHS